MTIQLNSIKEIITLLKISRDRNIHQSKLNRQYPSLAGKHKYHAIGLNEAIKIINDHLGLNEPALKAKTVQELFNEEGK